MGEQMKEAALDEKSGAASFLLERTLFCRVEAFVLSFEF
jgi:hypothetical protein